MYPIFEIKPDLANAIRNRDKKPKEKKHETFQRLQKIFFDNTSLLTAPKAVKKETIKSLETNTFLTKILTVYCKSTMEKWVKNNQFSKTFLNDLENLVLIIKQVFNHGSGLLPAYLAASGRGNFDKNLYFLISNDKYFSHVLKEVNTIIEDYDTIIKRHFSKSNPKTTLLKQAPIIGTSGQDSKDRNRLSTQFRMPGFPYILITTDILKEGVDLHSYCQDVFHYGIAWNPTDMEQRTRKN